MKHRTTSSTALLGRPERPFRYVNSVPLPNGSVGYDRPLENYFDTSMVSHLLPSHPTSRLYDTVARAHDSRFQVSTDTLDSSAPITRPLLLNQPERPRCLAKVNGNSPDYMGISPLAPEWRPRRSSYEDRRGAVGVSPPKVNTLVPTYIPPIDTTMPPKLKEWLDTLPKPVLQAHLEASQPLTDSSQPSTTEDDFTFGYDSDSPLEVRVTVPRATTPPPQPEESDSETDPYDSDTDSDSDHEYSYKFTPLELCRGNPEGLRWLIFPRRPSVDQDVAMDVTPPPSDKSPTRKRRRGRYAKSQVTKVPKRNANDTSARRTSKRTNALRQSDPEPGCSSEHTPSAHAASATATAPNYPVSLTAMEVDRVRMESRSASPSVGSQLNTIPSLNPTRSFPCLLDDCTQICASSGDLHRHQQSLRHRSPSYPCLACGKSYTRSDALKRHLNTKTSCRKLRTLKPGNNADAEPTQTKANTEAP